MAGSACWRAACSGPQRPCPARRPAAAAVDPPQCACSAANWPSCAAPKRWMPRRGWPARRCWPAFYINELLLRLAPRQDPQPELYEPTAGARSACATASRLAWTLRRFERDLLDALGVRVRPGPRQRWRADRPGRALRPGPAGGTAPAAQRARHATHAAAPPPAARCWHWPTTASPILMTWPACAGPCARCCCTTWAGAG